MRTKTFRVKFLAVILLTIICMFGCSDENKDEPLDPSDGDENNYEPLNTDDANASWGKAPLDPPGGKGQDNGEYNPTDGDSSSISDGDIDYGIDGDSSSEMEHGGCAEYEICVPVMCSEQQSLVLTCEEIEDEYGCMIPDVTRYVCPEGSQCFDFDSDGDVDIDIDCYPFEDGDSDNDSFETDIIDVESDKIELETENESNAENETNAKLKASETEILCPETREPLVLYMSNDDSNSMASPAFCKAKIKQNRIVHPSDVKIHEFLNYYDFNISNPNNAPAKVGMQMRRTNKDTGEFTLLLFAQGKKITKEDRRPINIVFSLDTSGSMSGIPMDLTRRILFAFAAQLKEGDIISLVEWSDKQNVLLKSHHIGGANDATLINIINNLYTGGSTDLHGGLVRAYQLARDNFNPERINRVVLISDGGANTGITDISLIAKEANDSNGEGIYMVGIGVAASTSYYYHNLMDDITDAGKGAYLYLDDEDEVGRMFNDPDKFLSILEVSARDVRMALTLPWYFGLKEFHGEEYSTNPEEVEPQHLAPNDVMAYHQIIQTCNADKINALDTIKAKVNFEDPFSREKLSDELKMTIADITEASATELRKSDVVVGYAQALIVIGDLWNQNRQSDAVTVAQNMQDWLKLAADQTEDKEIIEIFNTMTDYLLVLKQIAGIDTVTDGDEVNGK